MRIISGYLKGKKIFEPLDLKTRPLRDLVKETIFNIIQHSKKIKIDLKDAYVLDLFSGTGSFGLECLSRGAKTVTFFENYTPSINVLKKNLTNLKLENDSEIITKNALELDNILSNDNKFDLIFIDPPFKNNDLNKLIDKISSVKITNHQSLIIIHRNKKTKEVINNKFQIYVERTLGLSKIFFGKII